MKKINLDSFHKLNTQSINEFFGRSKILCSLEKATKKMILEKNTQFLFLGLSLYIYEELDLNYFLVLLPMLNGECFDILLLLRSSVLLVLS